MDSSRCGYFIKNGCRYLMSLYGRRKLLLVQEQSKNISTREHACYGVNDSFPTRERYKPVMNYRYARIKPPMLHFFDHPGLGNFFNPLKETERCLLFPDLRVILCANVSVKSPDRQEASLAKRPLPALNLSV